jgi:hypothetical protein
LIGDYSEVLLILAEGRNLDEASAQVQALGQNIAALISVASGPGAAAGLTGVLGALDPIIRDAAQRRNLDEMKRLVLSGAPLLKKLIETLRAAAPEVFNTLIFQSVKGDKSGGAQSSILALLGASRNLRLPSDTPQCGPSGLSPRSCFVAPG